MRIFKQIAAVTAVAGFTYVTAKAMMSAYETTGKMVKNAKLHRPLSEEERDRVLLEDIHNINHVYDQIKDIFEGYHPTDIEMDILRHVNPSEVEAMSDGFQTVEFESSFPETGDKKTASYRVFFCPTEDSVINNVVLRLHIDDWDGYIDIVLCKVLAKKVENKLFLEIIGNTEHLFNAPVVGEYLMYERFKEKESDNIIIQNKESKAKIIVVKFSNQW